MNDLLATLGIDTKGVYNYLKRESSIGESTDSDFSEEALEQVFIRSIEVEYDTEKQDATGNRATVVKKDGSGTNWNIKNVAINRKALLDALLDICEFVLSLSPLAIVRILKNIFEAVQVDLKSDEMFVFWQIYKASKRDTVFVDNILDIVQKAMVVEEYDDLSEKEVRQAVNKLLQLHMLKEKDGQIVVAEKVVLKYL